MRTAAFAAGCAFGGVATLLRINKTVVWNQAGLQIVPNSDHAGQLLGQCADRQEELLAAAARDVDRAARDDIDEQMVADAAEHLATTFSRVRVGDRDITFCHGSGDPFVLPTEVFWNIRSDYLFVAQRAGVSDAVAPWVQQNEWQRPGKQYADAKRAAADAWNARK